MNELREVGTITYEYKGKSKIERYWRDDIDDQIYIGYDSIESTDFSMPSPTGKYLPNLKDGFELNAKLTHEVKSPKPRENGYQQYHLYFEIENTELKGQGSFEIGLNYDGGYAQEESFFGAYTIITEE
ncbi:MULTISPECIES: hypothetical protein [Staphylococcus]|nr:MULTISPECIES: hypothetical protein [Staphylococcus]RNM18903.1 hypothetical protein EFY78_06800 [Staphylococcus pasteuri]